MGHRSWKPIRQRHTNKMPFALDDHRLVLSYPVLLIYEEAIACQFIIIKYGNTSDFHFCIFCFYCFLPYRPFPPFLFYRFNIQGWISSMCGGRVSMSNIPKNTRLMTAYNIGSDESNPVGTKPNSIYNTVCVLPIYIYRMFEFKLVMLSLSAHNEPTQHRTQDEQNTHKKTDKTNEKLVQ